MIVSRKRVRQIIREEINRSIPSCQLIEISIEGIPAKVELADTQLLRNKGLMYRQSIPDESGMLFVFPHDVIQGFWMKNTYVPLSIAFIDKEGIIVNIEDMWPQDHSSKLSASPVPYALEMNRGWFDRHGLKSGCNVLDLPRLPVD